MKGDRRRDIIKIEFYFIRSKQRQRFMPVSMKIIAHLSVSTTTLPVLFHRRQWKLETGNCKRSATRPTELSHLHHSYGDQSGHFTQSSGCFHKVFCQEAFSCSGGEDGNYRLLLGSSAKRHCLYFFFHNNYMHKYETEYPF